VEKVEVDLVVDSVVVVEKELVAVEADSVGVED